MRSGVSALISIANSRPVCVLGECRVHPHPSAGGALPPEQPDRGACHPDLLQAEELEEARPEWQLPSTYQRQHFRRRAQPGGPQVQGLRTLSATPSRQHIPEEAPGTRPGDELHPCLHRHSPSTFYEVQHNAYAELAQSLHKNDNFSDHLSAKFDFVFSFLLFSDCPNWIFPTTSCPG